MDSTWSKLTFHISVNIFKTDYSCFINHAIRHSVLNFVFFMWLHWEITHGVSIFLTPKGLFISIFHFFKKKLEVSIC